MLKINDDGGNDDLGLLWRKAMMMMRKPWRHWLERREPMLNQMVRHLRQPQKSLSFSSLSWPGSTTSTTKVAWLYFKTHNKGKLLCHYFQIWTSFQTIGQLLKTLTGFVQLCRDMLVTNMKLMRREKYVLPRNSFFWLIWRSGKFVGKSMERNPKIGLKKYFPRIHFFKMTPSKGSCQKKKTVFFGRSLPNMGGWGGWLPNKVQTPQNPPKSPRKSPFSTRISPFVLPNLTKILGWVGE